jgi:hypothetical protein
MIKYSLIPSLARLRAAALGCPTMPPLPAEKLSVPQGYPSPSRQMHSGLWPASALLVLLAACLALPPLGGCQGFVATPPTSEELINARSITDSNINNNYNGALINVKTYGALANGVTDDTAAVTNAIAASPVAGGVVYFPRGTYIMSSMLTVTNKPIEFLGDGQGISILIWTSAVTNGISFTANLITQNLLVTGLSLKTQAANLGAAILASWPSTVSAINQTTHIWNNEITFTTAGTTGWLTGINLTEAWNSSIHDNWITGVPPTGQTFVANSRGIIAQGQSNDIHISRCWVFHFDTAIFIGGTTHGAYIMDSTLVSNNNSVQMNTSADQPGVQVIGIHGASYQVGILLAHRYDIAIANNLLYKHTASTTNAWQGISVQSVAFGRIRVTGNEIDGIDATLAGSVGVNFQAGFDNTVTGNVFANTETAAWFQPGVNNSVMVGNRQVGTGVLGFRDQGTGNILGVNSPPGVLTTGSLNNVVWPTLKPEPTPGPKSMPRCLPCLLQEEP